MSDVSPDKWTTCVLCGFTSDKGQTHYCPELKTAPPNPFTELKWLDALDGPHVYKGHFKDFYDKYVGKLEPKPADGNSLTMQKIHQAMNAIYGKTPPMPQTGDIVSHHGKIYLVQLVQGDCVSLTPINSPMPEILMERNSQWKKIHVRIRYRTSPQADLSYVAIDIHDDEIIYGPEKALEWKAESLVAKSQGFLHPFRKIIADKIWSCLKGDTLHIGWNPLAKVIDQQESFSSKDLRKPGEQEARVEAFDPGIGDTALEDNPFAAFQQYHEKKYKPKAHVFKGPSLHQIPKAPVSDHLAQMGKAMGEMAAAADKAASALGDFEFFHFEVPIGGDKVGLNLDLEAGKLTGINPGQLVIDECHLVDVDFEVANTLAKKSSIHFALAYGMSPIKMNELYFHKLALMDLEETLTTGSFIKKKSPIAPTMHHHAHLRPQTPRKARRDKSGLARGVTRPYSKGQGRHRRSYPNA